jgi:perosamine synthetase
MARVATEDSPGNLARGQDRATPSRRLALFGGTTTLADCQVATRFLIDPRRMVRGTAIGEYERAFARFVGVRFASSFWAGRVGLYGILRAMDIGPGDEVLVQAPTHIVVANAVRYTGATPVYVDCRLDTYNMDLNLAERRITDRTKAIILQHTFGIPNDMDAAIAMANRSGLEVIEDCVHALGATYDGRQVGSFGRAAFFSTEETKTITSTMGGMVVTDDPEIGARIKMYQDACAWPSRALTSAYLAKLVLYHLLTEPRVHRFTRPIYQRFGERHPLPQATTEEEVCGARPDGYDMRLSNAQAVLAWRQLRRLEDNIEHRHAVASEYHARLAAIGFEVPKLPAKAKPAYVRFPIRVADRKSVVRAAAPHAMLGTWFTSVLEESSSPIHGGYEPGSCPNAEAIAEQCVNLPTHPRVQPGDVQAIVAAIARATAPNQIRDEAWA